MSLAAQLMAGAAAVILLVVASLEALLIHRPWVQRLLRCWCRKCLTA